MGRSVYLSPSTQENNKGVGMYGTEEMRMNQIADVVEKILKQHEITVYRNRPEMTLTQLVSDSNNKKPEIHFAIHSNAGGGGNTRGCEVYCHSFGGNSERLARAIYAKLEPLTPSSDRGVKESHSHFGPGKPLYELAKTDAPAALVEVAFHDNKDDTEWIINNIEVIGSALAKGLLTYFGTPYIENKGDTDIANKLYKVQVGAFSMRKNAETLLQRLKAHGFNGYIKQE